MKITKSKKIFLSLLSLTSVASLISVPALAASCTYVPNKVEIFNTTFNEAYEFSKTLKEANQQAIKKELREVLVKASSLAFNDKSTQKDVDKAVEMIKGALTKAKESLYKLEHPELQTPEEKLSAFLDTIKDSVLIKNTESNKLNIKNALDNNKNVIFDKNSKSLLTDLEQKTNDINLKNENWDKDVQLISPTTEENTLVLEKDKSGKVLLKFRLLLKSGDKNVISKDVITIELGSYDDLTKTQNPQIPEEKIKGIYFKDKKISTDKLQLTYVIEKVENKGKEDEKIKLIDDNFVTYIISSPTLVKKNSDLFASNKETEAKLLEILNMDNLEGNIISADANIKYDKTTNKVTRNEYELVNAKYIGEFTTINNLGTVSYFFIPKDLVEIVKETSK